jgi:DNA end-binding protein Ku
MAERKRRRDSDETAGAPPRSRAFWSGTISFGLVSIPVDLYSAHRPGRVSLRMLSPDGVPLRRRYFCPKEDREVPGSELVRGYEVEPGEHVVVTDEELESLEPRRSRDIDLTRFVPANEVDPMAFQRGYFLAPAGDSTKAYRLLAAVMEETGRAGIATFVMRGREYLVAILAENGVLRAATLRFADEIRRAEAVGLPEPEEAPAAAVRKAEKAIGAASAGKLDADELADPWGERMAALAAKKLRHGEDVVEVPEEAAAESGAEVIDLMAVLKRSLGASGPRPQAAKGGRGGAATRQGGGRKASPARRGASKEGTSERKAGKRGASQRGGSRQAAR